jgi:hypothetical protein
LIALSSDQIEDEEWAWCSYSTEIYVTIRNAGNGSYEGNYFINSSSSATNKENYFVHNHTYKANYKSSNYDSVVTKTADYTMTGGEGIILIDAGSDNMTVTLPTAAGREGQKYIVKVLDMLSGQSVYVDANGSETIDGGATYAFTADYQAITVVSDGSNWHIVGKVN